MRPDVDLVTMGLSKLLFNEYSLFAELNLLDEWKFSFLTLLRNIEARTIKKNRPLRQRVAEPGDECFQKSSDELQNQNLRENAKMQVVFQRLQSLPKKGDSVLKGLQEMNVNDIDFAIQKIKEFLNGPGSQFNYDFLDGGLKDMISKWGN